MWICPKCKRSFEKTNQGHYCGKPPATVEEYIQAQRSAARPHLTKMRLAICGGIPDANECIIWSMPTYKRGGRSVSFAACNDHVSFYAGADAIAAFKEELGEYKTNKSAVYFPYGKELPLKLIESLAKWCLM